MKVCQRVRSRAEAVSNRNGFELLDIIDCVVDRIPWSFGLALCSELGSPCETTLSSMRLSSMVEIRCI